MDSPNDSALITKARPQITEIAVVPLLYFEKNAFGDFFMYIVFSSIKHVIRVLTDYTSDEYLKSLPRDHRESINREIHNEVTRTRHNLYGDSYPDVLEGRTLLRNRLREHADFLFHNILESNSYSNLDHFLLLLMKLYYKLGVCNDDALKTIVITGSIIREHESTLSILHFFSHWVSEERVHIDKALDEWYEVQDVFNLIQELSLNDIIIQALRLVAIQRLERINPLNIDEANLFFAALFLHPISMNFWVVLMDTRPEGKVLDAIHKCKEERFGFERAQEKKYIFNQTLSLFLEIFNPHDEDRKRMHDFNPTHVKRDTFASIPESYKKFFVEI